jgi:hypothetical protein
VELSLVATKHKELQMHISPEEVLNAVDEQKAALTRLSLQFNANEFEVVMANSLALVVLLQELIVEQTTEREDLAWEAFGMTDLTGMPLM